MDLILLLDEAVARGTEGREGADLELRLAHAHRGGELAVLLRDVQGLAAGGDEGVPAVFRVIVLVQLTRVEARGIERDAREGVFRAVFDAAVDAGVEILRGLDQRGDQGVYVLFAAVGTTLPFSSLVNRESSSFCACVRLLTNSPQLVTEYRVSL